MTREYPFLIQERARLLRGRLGLQAPRGRHIRIVIMTGDEDPDSCRVAAYQGKGTDQAIKARLTRERRAQPGAWAFAIIYSHDEPHGPVGRDFETGNEVPFPEVTT